jgi:formamidopyrimidine-DNA glycosylase
MPELPEVETVARGLRATLEGHRIVAVSQNRADLRVPFPADLPRRLRGRRVVHIGRRAKYLLLTLDDDSVLIVHLGMSGRFVIRRDTSLPASPHDHLVLTADDGLVYVLNDPRRFGLVALAEARQLDGHMLFAGLGPEPLGNGFDAKTLAASLAGKKTPIKSALLDQRVVAGLGNIYVCEALFRAGLSPLRLAGTIKGAKAERLARSIRAVLDAAIAAGGSSLRDFVHHDGELGYFQHHFGVYGQTGKACPGCVCDIALTGGVARIAQAGRSTFYCPRKQR